MGRNRSAACSVLPRVGDEVLVDSWRRHNGPVITVLLTTVHQGSLDPTETNKISEITETDEQFRYVSGIHDVGGN